MWLDVPWSLFFLILYVLNKFTLHTQKVLVPLVFVEGDTPGNDEGKAHVQPGHSSRRPSAGGSASVVAVQAVRFSEAEFCSSAVGILHKRPSVMGRMLTKIVWCPGPHEMSRTRGSGWAYRFQVLVCRGMQIAEEATKALNWLSEKVALQEQALKSDEPVLLTADILKKEDTLRRFAEPILSTPPPPSPKVKSLMSSPRCNVLLERCASIAKKCVTSTPLQHLPHSWTV